MSFDFTKWYEEHSQRDSDTIFSYEGDISEDIIVSILDKIELILEKKAVKGKVFKKIYHLSVEVLQNLYHHSETPTDALKTDKKKVAFILKENKRSKINCDFIILSGNFVHKSNTRLLRQRIDQLNYLSKEELKTLYKIILNNQVFSQKGGGGLGMIDIVKRSENNLNYDFCNFNNDFIFFTLSIAI